jgi:hypothetical protein
LIIVIKFTFAMSSEESLDLPLLSLESDYKVEHYLLKLTCHVEQKTFCGEVYVFVKKNWSRVSLDFRSQRFNYRKS